MVSLKTTVNHDLDSNHRQGEPKAGHSSTGSNRKDQSCQNTIHQDTKKITERNKQGSRNLAFTVNGSCSETEESRISSNQRRAEMQMAETSNKLVLQVPALCGLIVYNVLTLIVNSELESRLIEDMNCFS